MIKRANALWATLMVAPIVFILVSVSTVGEAGRGLGGLDTGFLILLVIVSVADVVLIFYTQTSQRFSASLMRRAPWAEPTNFCQRDQFCADQSACTASSSPCFRDHWFTSWHSLQPHGYC